MSRIFFRPHHFMCTLGFIGKGYSPEFVENYKQISSRLFSEGGDETEIEVVGKTDSICSPCPSRRGDLCEEQKKIDQLDHAHAKVLGIEVGEKYKWKEAKELIRTQMSDESFNRVCAPCRWKSMGACQKALEKNRLR